MEGIHVSLAKYIALSKLEAVRVSGRGGKEKDIAPLLPRWSRVGKAIHDYGLDSPDGLLRLEVKKQQNLQWFDVGKYHDLTADSRLIWVLFIIHKEGAITRLLTARLGAFVDFLCSLPKSQKLGWNEEVFKTAARFKLLYPALQFKVKAEILTLHHSYPELFEVVYPSEPRH